MKFYVLLFCLASWMAHAEIEIISEELIQYPHNPRHCFQDATCSLKNFDMQVFKKSVTLPGEADINASLMTDVRLILKTSHISELQSYGVVQYIRGCKFTSTWNGQTVTKTLDISRLHFNHYKTFKHADWEVDSDTEDPVYHSYNGDRFALWRWNTNPDDYNPETATYMIQRPPPHATVFLTDMPGVSFLNPNSAPSTQTAQNSSLQFRSCLFKMSDLPQRTDESGTNIDPRKAILCHTWSDSFVFDFQQRRMRSPANIDPVCL